MKKSMLVFAAMGMELVGVILGGILLGRWLDDKYGWNGIGVLSLSILCLVGWLVHIIVLLRQMESKSSDNSP